MKRKTLPLWALLLAVLTLEGCATTRGIGEDLQDLGRALKKAVWGRPGRVGSTIGLRRAISLL